MMWFHIKAIIFHARDKNISSLSTTLIFFMTGHFVRGHDHQIDSMMGMPNKWNHMIKFLQFMTMLYADTAPIPILHWHIWRINTHRFWNMSHRGMFWNVLSSNNMTCPCTYVAMTIKSQLWKEYIKIREFSSLVTDKYNLN